jgi:hypothetical protein
MIETYGKITTLDGKEFPYTDFRESRKEALAKAEARDRTILAARENHLGRPLTIRERLAPVTCEEAPTREPIADAVTKKETPPASECIVLPFPLTATAKPLTPGEEAAKKSFAEMHLAAALAQQAKKTQPPSIP